jgi:protein TonB
MRPASAVAAVAPDTDHLPSGLFRTLVLDGDQGTGKHGRAGFLASLSLHSALMAAVVVLPLVFYDAAPGQDVLKGFFATPIELAPPPAPTLPQNGKVVRIPKIVVPPPFVLPPDIPDGIVSEDSIILTEAQAVGRDLPPGTIIGPVPNATIAVPKPPPPVVRVGGMLAAPRLVHKVDPVYPADAKTEGVQGIFLIDVMIGKDGAITDARVAASAPTPERLSEMKAAKGPAKWTPAALEGDARLAKAALEAVRQWRYEPMLKDGKPVDAEATLTVKFKLQ